MEIRVWSTNQQNIFETRIEKRGVLEDTGMINHNKTHSKREWKEGGVLEDTGMINQATKHKYTKLERHQKLLTHYKYTLFSHLLSLAS